MMMPGRNYSSGTGYRYGFNGKEDDDELKGEGNQQDYGMRIYDPRIGKFLSVDPLSPNYPELTPYQFASNRPIDGIDLDGLEYSNSSTNTHKTNSALFSGNRSSTFLIINLGFLKVNRLSYANKPLISLNGSDKASTFAGNAVRSIWNQTISSIEDNGAFVYNYLSSSKFRKEFKASALNSIFKGLSYYAETNMRQKASDFSKAAYGYVTNIENWENLAGAVIATKFLGGSSAAFSEGNSFIKSAVKDGVKVMQATSADDIAYLKSMNSKALYMGAEGSQGYILTTSAASRVEILEEAIHHSQRIYFGDDIFYSNRNLLEFSAQEKLLEIGAREGWSKAEMNAIRKAKRTWAKEYLKEKSKK